MDAIHAQVRRVNMIAENIRDEGQLQDKLLDEICKHENPHLNPRLHPHLHPHLILTSSSHHRSLLPARVLLLRQLPGTFLSGRLRVCFVVVVE